MFAAVLGDVRLGCFTVMVLGLQMMSVSQVRVMSRLFVMAGFVVFRGFVMMFRSVLVMFSGLFVVLVMLMGH
jgi:hypothetical protein